MAINKVIYGNDTLIDLTSDTVDSSNLLSGYTAHDRSGTPITGSVITANVIDNLTSTSTTDALSANQGRVLKNTKLEESANNVLGAKNLLPMTVSDIKNINTSGTWSGNTYTFRGISWTILVDSDNNVIGIKANEQATANSFFDVGVISPSVANGNILNGCPSNGTSTTYFIEATNLSNKSDKEYGNGLTITDFPSSPNIRIRLTVYNGYTCPNEGLIFYPMIRLSSYTDSTFEPYAMTNLALTNKKADKSELPTVNNGTLTIQKNGTSVATFSANQSSNATANILVDELTESTDNEPYTLRQGKGDMVYLDLVGGSYAWNQLVQNGNFANGTTNWSIGASVSSFTASNNEASYTASAQWGRIEQTLTVDSTHVVLVKASLKGTTNHYLNFNGTSKFLTQANVYQDIAILTKNLQYKVVTCGDRSTSNFAECKVKNVVAHDLTAMLGTTIADAIYAMEQATAGSGVAWFRQYFPNAYYAYDTGSIQSVNVASRKVVGKNLYNVPLSLIVGASVNNNGTNVSGTITASNGIIGCASQGGFGYRENVVKVMPNTQYTFSVTGNIPTLASRMYIQEGDENKNFTTAWRQADGTSLTFTTSANTEYVILNYNFTNATVGDYISINFQVEFGTTATAYEPYEEHIANFDATKQLRGIPSIVNNKLVYDGDIYTPNGITRKWNISHLGGLNWETTTIGGNSAFKSEAVSDTEYTGTSARLTDILVSQRYLPKNDASNLSICILGNDHRFYIRDDAYSDVTTFKSSLDGVYAVYLKQTPTIESAEPYQNPQRADASGTEEFIDFGVSAGTRDVSIPCGHNSTYKSSEVIQPLEDYVDGYRINDIRDNVAWYENNGFLSKNLLPITLASVKNANNGTWSGNVCTIRGVTFTVNTNNEGYVTTIVANNTATGGNANFYIPVANNIYKGCILSGLPQPTQNCNLLFQLGVSPYTTNVDSTGDGVKITIDNGNSCNVILQVPNNVSVSNLEFKPMIRHETTEDDSYTPYAPSNLELMSMIPIKLYATGSFTSSTSTTTTVTVTNANINYNANNPIEVTSDVFGLTVSNISVSGSGTGATISITFPKMSSAQTVNYRVYIITI